MSCNLSVTLGVGSVREDVRKQVLDLQCVHAMWVYTCVFQSVSCFSNGDVVHAEALHEAHTSIGARKLLTAKHRGAISLLE